MPQDSLTQTVQYLPGVGPARADLLRKLGIETVGDLLFHFPRSYEDLSDMRGIDQLTEGVLQTVQGEIVEIEGRELPDGRTIVGVVINDGQGCIEGVWFNQPYAASRFRFGQRVAFSGKPTWYRDHWQMGNPRVRVLDAVAAGEPVGNPGMIVPVYPLTEDLHPEQLRAVMRRALERFASLVVENLPEELRKRRALPDAPKAIQAIHLPDTIPAALAARRRFVYEEFLILQLALALRRREVRKNEKAPVLPVTPAIDARIRRLFPFTLTADQDKAIAQICKDLASDRPMQRLLQADVGAGKTAVAVYALLVTVACKHQAILMAPTEVLARQHWHTLERYLAQSRVRRLLLTGGLTAKDRKAALEQIRQGEVDLVVGTQALVQEDVQFARLGLVIVDEQHKFGVNQRARVRKLGVDPHYLVMTATPIPRTIALTVFGDLDVSIIKQMPPGRLPVVTRWVPAGRREKVYELIREGLKQGRQAYFVCPLVEESETLDLKAAEQTHAELQAGPLRDFRLGLLHGRLDDKVKDDVMERFRKGEIDVLVSTVVIEVGVDVPNATLMVIEHADRFGLSQLHQLRGRVSRGKTAGQCFLFGDASGADARQRLEILTRTSSGFELAEEDVKIRGLGEFFGTRQHGLGELRFGDLIADQAILLEAREDAFNLVAEDAGLRKPENGLLRQKVLECYGKTLDLAEVG